MANVFEGESNASQDANYREHLNINWQNGNNEFDKLENWLNALKSSINGFQEQISELSAKYRDLYIRVEEDEIRHYKDVDTLTKKHNDDSEATNQRLTKLEKAVFEAQYINDTKSDVEAKPSITHEINDTHVVNDDNGIIIQDEHQTLPNDVN